MSHCEKTVKVLSVSMSENRSISFYSYFFKKIACIYSLLERNVYIFKLRFQN